MSRDLSVFRDLLVYLYRGVCSNPVGSLYSCGISVHIPFIIFYCMYLIFLFSYLIVCLAVYLFCWSFQKTQLFDLLIFWRNFCVCISFSLRDLIFCILLALNLFDLVPLVLFILILGCQFYVFSFSLVGI